jgi:alpha-galactosidase
MLVVGMYGEGNVAHGGCNDAEYRSHFTLWCLLAAPLMIGCDVRSMSQATKDILMNRELIAVNQDPMGAQGFRIGKAFHGRNRGEIWAKPLEDGSIAVGMFNLSEMDARRMTVAWESLGLHDRRTCAVRDMIAGADIGEATGQFSTRVGKHDVVAVRLAPVK